MKRMLIWVFIGTIFSSCCAQKDMSILKENGPSYLGLSTPSVIPEIFAPGVISQPDRYEFGCVISKDRSEIFYGVDVGGKSEIHSVKLENGTWSTSNKLFADSMFSYNDPMLSPDEQRLYFISNQSLDGSRKSKDIDIWYSERENGLWSAPINAGRNINSHREEYYISFTATGTMYFASNIETVEGRGYDFDIYSSAYGEGGFERPIRLDKNVNTNQYEADVFIAPDESYIIFCAKRREGFGKGDLYVSFKDDNGNWSLSKNMGEVINSAGHELCPFVTNDGKYLVYTRAKEIYWVDTDILDQLRE